MTRPAEESPGDQSRPETPVAEVPEATRATTESQNAESGGADLGHRLEGLKPLMSLLDQAREAVAGGKGQTPREQPPNQLGDFDLLSPIGRGGMGVVYEARQRSLDRIVALKVLPKSVLPEPVHHDDTAHHPRSDHQLVQRFHQEAKAAARLHHSHIVPVFGFGEAEGFYYFVMQRIYGQSLDRWIQTNTDPQSPTRLGDRQIVNAVARFGAQAASGLAYAHQEGVLHRDIKPANLLIDEEGTLQIADFGVARVDDADALTRTSDVVGTLRYMAPEQISGDATIQSDVYSLGVTLYEMATGKPAIDDASVRQAILLQKRPSGPIGLAKAAPFLPLDLRTIVDKAMEPDASRRYESASALAGDLDRFLNGRAIVARPMPWWEKSQRWVARNRTVSVLTSLLIAALSMVALLSTVNRIQADRALHESLVAKRDAVHTAELASGAMEQVFERFSASADSTSISFDAHDFSAPAVDPKTAALLQEMLGYYDTLSRRSGNAAVPAMQTGEARLHLGAIYQQLGDHLSAIESYEEAIAELGDEDPLLQARIHNQIGVNWGAIGRRAEALPHHQLAIELLEGMGEDAKRPEVRFEKARGLMLNQRKIRPGMGPMAYPPAEAFIGAAWFASNDREHFDPWRELFELGWPSQWGDPQRDRRPRPGPDGRPPPRPDDGRDGGPRGPRGYGDRPDGDGFGPPPRRRGPPGDSRRGDRPHREGPSHPGPPPPGLGESSDFELVDQPRDDGRQFATALDLLVELKAEQPGSLPVTLLLSNLVRQSMVDVLRSRERVNRSAEQHGGSETAERSASTESEPHGEARLVLLADQLESELADALQRGQWKDNDAAIAYELIQLLTDFNAFRRMSPETMRLAHERLEKAIESVDYLVGRYPNVPAYETLAIHTYHKAALLKMAVYARGPGPKPEDSREIRMLLRQAYKRQIQLIERGPGARKPDTVGYAHGYQLWAALFLMEMGDMQLQQRDHSGAARTYRRALRQLPLKNLDWDAESASVAAVTANGESSEHPVAIGTVVILRRLAHEARRSQKDLAERADEIADRIIDESGGPWLIDDINELLARTI